MVNPEKLDEIYFEELERTGEPILALLAVYDYGWNEGYTRAASQALEQIKTYVDKLEGIKNEDS